MYSGGLIAILIGQSGFPEGHPVNQKVLRANQNAFPANRFDHLANQNRLRVRQKVLFANRFRLAAKQFQLLEERQSPIGKQKGINA